MTKLESFSKNISKNDKYNNDLHKFEKKNETSENKKVTKNQICAKQIF
jgi:hypothetical protein